MDTTQTQKNSQKLIVGRNFQGMYEVFSNVGNKVIVHGQPHKTYREAVAAKRVLLVG